MAEVDKNLEIFPDGYNLFPVPGNYIFQFVYYLHEAVTASLALFPRHQGSQVASQPF